MEEYKNILIVRTDRLGDVVLTTPSIKALRNAYPKAQISIIVASATRELLEANPYLDEIIVDDRKGINNGFVGFLRLVDFVRKKKFDLAILFHTKRRTNLLCFLAGIKNRIGYKNNKFGFLLTKPINDERHYGKKHEAEYCLDVLKHIGLESKDLDMHVSVKKESEQWMYSFLHQNKISDDDCFICIHPGASDPAKRWPKNNFAELIDELVKKYNSKIVIVGSSDVRPIAKEILSSINSSILDLSGKTTVGELASLLMRADLLISNDSGPVHLAAALNTPVISIFTRNQPGINPERWKPLGDKSIIVSVKPHKPRNIFQKSQKIDSKDLELIATNEILEAVDSVFKL
ncbi:MAG: lipopolysaccharide heptosyltransferase II [Candidatus Zapsychrus exili]|nr:lipopolysaccharide heptosyltransferase II [Candidatus Zapsychrus exili]